MKTIVIVSVLSFSVASGAAQPAPPMEVQPPGVMQPLPVQPMPVLPPAPPEPPPLPEALAAPEWAAPAVSRGYLGIGVAEIDAERAKALKLAEERGVEITRVEPDSPAEKAGLKQGDVVLEYNGQRVEGAEQFVRLVRETPPGRKVTLLISRNGVKQTLTAVTGRREVRGWALGPEFERQMERLRENLRDMQIQVEAAPRVYMSWRSSILGVEAESLSDQLAEFFGVKEGVLVRSVMKGTPAEKAGLKAGDVITKVDGEPVRRPSQVADRIRKPGEKRTVELTIVRNRQEMKVTVTLEEPPRGRREAPPRPRTIVDQRGVRI